MQLVYHLVEPTKPTLVEQLKVARRKRNNLPVNVWVIASKKMWLCSRERHADTHTSPPPLPSEVAKFYCPKICAMFWNICKKKSVYFVFSLNFFFHFSSHLLGLQTWFRKASQWLITSWTGWYHSYQIMPVGVRKV